LAISGGVDSIVLAHLCKTAGYDLELMHVNFQLRGDESQRDESFVQQFSEDQQLKLHLKRVDTDKYAQQNRVSIQVAARDIRYKWFEEIRSTYSDKPTW